MRSARPPGRGRARAHAGQATVELVLVLPVVVLVLLLVVQLAVVVRAQVLVVEAARSGARAASVGSDPRRAAAQTPGLERGRLRVEVREVGDEVEVQVRYAVPTEVPLVGALLGDPTVSARVRMVVEDQPDQQTAGSGGAG